LPSSLFGGSVLFARKDGGTNRIHAVLHVDAQSGGAVSGRLDLDSLGKFNFDGSMSNDVLVLVFDSSGGSGSLIASEKSDGSLNGELLGTIGGVATAGSVRLHDNGGRVTSTNVSTFTGTTGGTGFSGQAISAPSVAGTYGGTISFQGDAPIDELTVNSTARKRFHAVLHLGTASSDSALLGGNFRIDHVGRYHLTGATTLGQTTLVFSGSNGAGSMVLGSIGSSSLNTFTPVGSTFNAAALDLSGKLFGVINGVDVHARVLLHNTVTGPPSDLGETNPSTINVGSNQFGSISSPAPTPTTPTPTIPDITAPDITTPGTTAPDTNTFLPSGMSGIGMMGMDNSGQLIDSVFG
jgi:hypothetical protein